MRIFRSVEEVPASFGPAVVTIGNFDGVHTGHAEIMRRVAFAARETGATPTVLTFDPHPAQVLAPERAPKLIMTVNQRLRRMEQMGMEAALLIPFSFEFARLSPEEFAQRILLDKLHAKTVMVGVDFRFGYRMSGDVLTLRHLGARLGFEVQPVEAIAGHGERVSSSRIRKLVLEGRVLRACRLMGTPFALEGAVVRGQGIGSKQTVPTLNLAPENELLPKSGVYVTRTRDEASGKRWRSITNVGFRPTFDGRELTVETFLLEPLDGPAPARIEVSFLGWVRDERKFASAEILRAQILRDVGAATRFHRRFTRLVG